MKKYLLCICLAFTMLCGCLSGCEKGNEKLRIGAAGVGGPYYEFSNAFAKLVQDEDEKYSFEVKATAGSAANIRLLSENYIQAAVAQADLANDAYFGTGVFAGDKTYDGYSAVAGLYTEACQIVVRKDSGIETLEDLYQKTVSVGEKESGTEKNAEQILAATGLSAGMVKKVNLDYTNATASLEDGEIDAFFCTAGAQTTVIEGLAKQCEIRLVEIDEETAKRLMDAYGFYREYMIPAGTYTGQKEDIKTLGVQSLLLVSDKMSDETVYFITKTLFKYAKDLQYSVTVDLKIDEKNAVNGVTIPFHSGAGAYYREKGIEVNIRDTKQVD